LNLFDYSNITQISDLVREQFPQFYNEEGPNFIDFIEAYYEYLQDPSNPVGLSRSIYKEFDIDRASKDFLNHYREKYMWGLPANILGNQRLLQKHILELYRAKGSQQGVRLLFRLLFNEDIDFYIPSYDIFKLSDNTWNEPQYLEVTYSDDMSLYIGQEVSGLTSQAKAIVESYQSRVVNGIATYILYISNIRGEFVPNESVVAPGIDPVSAAIIKGSVVGVRVQSSGPGFSVGDAVTSASGDNPVKIAVSSTYTGSGSLEFSIIDEGTYYSLDTAFIAKPPAHIDPLEPVVYEDIDADEYGFPKNPTANLTSGIQDSLYTPGVDNIIPSNVPITGSGADIKIKSLKNTFTFRLFDDLLIDYVDVELRDEYGFPKSPTSNTDTIIAESLVFQSLTVGNIDTIQVLNPGLNYSTVLYFQPIDPYTSTSGILDANGVQVGTNGLVLGTPQLGTSIVSEAIVLNSGFDNIRYNSNIFVDSADPSMTITATPIVGGVGRGEGYFENTKSFMSSDKYFFDGHYYQDFSYVIRASMSLDKYIDILKQIAHPAGNAVYGDVLMQVTNQIDNRVVQTALKKIPI
jgi:hypothetical protein